MRPSIRTGNGLRRSTAVLTCGLVLLAALSVPAQSARGGRAPRQGADLAVTKSDSPDPVVVGGELTYTIVAKNKGPVTATGVRVEDTLPSEVQWSSTTTTKGACEPSVCTVGDLLKNESVTITIKVVPNSPGTITNVVSTSGQQTDPSAANNTASVTTNVTSPPPPPTLANLAITVTDSPDPYVTVDQGIGIEPGPTEPLTYTISVTNNGPDAATGVVLTDTFTEGERFFITSKSEVCTGGSSGPQTCSIGSIPGNGSTAVVTISVIFPCGRIGLVANTASVTAKEPDPDLTNNTETEETLVETRPFGVCSA